MRERKKEAPNARTKYEAKVRGGDRGHVDTEHFQGRGEEKKGRPLAGKGIAYLKEQSSQIRYHGRGERRQ